MQSTVFLDIHAGEASEDLTGFVCFCDNKNTPENTAQARRLAACAGFPLMMIDRLNISQAQPAEYAWHLNQ